MTWLVSASFLAQTPGSVKVGQTSRTGSVVREIRWLSCCTSADLLTPETCSVIHVTLRNEPRGEGRLRGFGCIDELTCQCFVTAFQTPTFPVWLVAISWLPTKKRASTGTFRLKTPAGGRDDEIFYQQKSKTSQLHLIWSLKSPVTTSNKTFLNKSYHK